MLKINSKNVIRTDARGNVRAALLIALGASVTRHSGDPIFAGALSRGLVARFPRRADRVTVTC